MSKRRTAAVLASLGIAFGALVPAGTASAASPEQLCEASGGTYTKTGSTNECSYPVGNSDNTKDVDQKGSFNSSHDEGFTNPGDNRPPGQQGGDTLGN